MASIDTNSAGFVGLSVSSEQTEVVVNAESTSRSGGEGDVSGANALEEHAVAVKSDGGEKREKERLPALVDGQATSRPSMVNAATTLSSSSVHTKKFSAVNINKKFLEKTSSSSASSVPSNSATVKTGNSAPRPAAQSTLSHSRLVAAKLTATPQPSATPGPGWSRPPSAASPAVPSPSSTPSAVLQSTPPVPVAPQLPHAGKVIQPQPRPAANISTVTKNDVSSGTVKTVWGNVKTAVSAPPQLHNDFPTAAEVAQVASSGKKAKAELARETPDTPVSERNARSEDADAFRGVHLDPNAHHWDEMEEVDDNFLDDVIEFGDGRQYKIEPAQVPPSKPTSPTPPRRLEEVGSSEPVSKEERFADDFDRSWPRSKSAVVGPHGPHDSLAPQPQHPGPVSPVSSHSPLESSRVLFNERSNRLEPYSVQRQGSSPGPHIPLKRGSEYTHPFGDQRNGRDLPPHGPPANVQLLQKYASVSSNELPRHRRFSATGYAPPPPLSHDRHRDQGPSGRNTALPALHIPLEDSEWRHSRDQVTPSSAVSPGTGRDRDHRSNPPSSSFGPPSVSNAPFASGLKEHGRQLPPHLSDPSSSQRLPSREPHPRPPSSLRTESVSSITVSSTHLTGQSPVASHSSLPGGPAGDVSSVPSVDTDEVYKAAMHNAAERARLRRQQEEEEREKEKERARKKAAELEAKIKTVPSENLQQNSVESTIQEGAAVAINENAIRNVQPEEEPSIHTTFLPPKTSFTRQPSSDGAPRPTFDHSRPPLLKRRTSVASSTEPASAAIEAESWRSRANLNPVPVSEISQSRPPLSPLSPLVPIPSFLQAIETLDVPAEEELEVVDFSDLDKFVGHTRGLGAPAPNGISSRPHRPVASDFFDDSGPLLDTPKSDSGSWRRKSQQPKRSQDEVVTSSVTLIAVKADEEERPPAQVEVAVKEHRGYVDQSHNSVIGNPDASSTSVQRGLRNPHIHGREPAMSSLDDAISRIKGALDGMQADVHPQAAEASLLSPQALKSTLPLAPIPPKPEVLFRDQKESKWVPPALRLRRPDIESQLQELFDVTSLEPPRSPKPAWKTYHIRLPKYSRGLELVSRRQIVLAMSPPAPLRWDILSWNPPVEHMRGDFSLNDVLFGRIRLQKGNFYDVRLPKATVAGRAGDVHTTQTVGPRVHLPSSPRVNETRSDQVDYRRQLSAHPGQPQASAAPQSDFGLDTVSRSPPPEVLSNASIVSAATTTAPSKEMLLGRSRLQPKMPAGSAVAFYRDSRVDTPASEVKNSVQFIVHSELDDSSQPISANETELVVDIAPLEVRSGTSKDESDDKAGRAFPMSAPAAVAGLKSNAASPHTSSQDKESKSPHVSLATTPSTSTAWASSSFSFPVKESQSRAPDPEHLKAVWSQAPEKDPVPSVNSLEAIPDDLTSLPFMLQEVKSDDGGTPPPSTAATMRMSAHDVTRAFQQVPTSNSSISHSVTESPRLSSNSSVGRPAFVYPAAPAVNPSARMPYASYPSPMMNNSPGPTIVYPHPVAASPAPTNHPMNGHSPLYGQGAWVPVSGPHQSHPGMMRPMASYPAQLMSYPSPGGAAMYQPQANGTPGQPPLQQNVATHNRMTGMMSPVVSHALPAHPGMPMYGGSPVLLHSPMMQMAPAQGYMSPMPVGRGQMRTDSQLPPPNGHSSHNAYPTHPSNFARPSW